MCTAITYKTKDHYFGRNLDLEFSYHETVTITPRNYPFYFRKTGKLMSHYAMIGMAYVVEGYPLYYEATNEKGLSMAGLNFPDYADYKAEMDGKDNIAPFEFVPWILSQCASLPETRELLERINLIKIDFSPELPLTPLHWMISDRESSIVVEAVKEGLRIYDNPVEVLTNNPPFEFQWMNLQQYMGVTREEPVNRFSEKLTLKPFSRGMGAIGLPGDFSSVSRFVRAAFVRMNAVSGDSEEESVSQFFHILGSVEQQRGCVQTTWEKVSDGVQKCTEEYEMTLYTSCCNTDKGIYYYVTYDNRQITAVDMYGENLEGTEVIAYSLRKKQEIFWENKN